MSTRKAVVAGTWAFASQPVTVAARLVGEGRACEECLEKALNVVEEDEKYGPYQVGRGGPPNEQGEVELDAAIMSGQNLNFGAVTALQGISRASSVARCVMERSPHSMLSGQGAQDFALKSGFHIDIIQCRQSEEGNGRNGNTNMQTSKITDGVSERVNQHHDTMGLLVFDTQGNIAAGVTTSGMKGKARGRIGDSSLPGCGLYADNEVGAVCCSGDGDHIMKFCPSFMVMEYMRQGLSPESSCQAAVKRINQRLKSSPPLEVAIIAVNIMGEVGAASTVKEWRDPITDHCYPGFPLVVWKEGKKTATEPEICIVPSMF